MDNELLKSIEETMELYHRKIKPDNRRWDVLSIVSEMSPGMDITYKQFGVGNNYNMFNPLIGEQIPDKKWDIIIMSQVIQYVYDFVGLLTRCHELLKDGGFLVIDCPFVQEYDKTSKHEDYWRISHKALQNLLNEIGFEYGNCGLINGHLTSALARKAKND